MFKKIFQIVFSFYLLSSVTFALENTKIDSEIDSEGKKQASEPPKSMYRDLSLIFGQRTAGVSVEEKYKYFVKFGDIKELAESKDKDSVKKEQKKSEKDKEEDKEREKQNREREVFRTQNHYRALYNLFAINDEKRIKDEADEKCCADVKLTRDVWHDLRIFAGDRGSPLSSLSTALRCTQTKCGTVFMERLLSKPVADTDVLKKRQRFLKRLIEDDDFYESVRSLINKISENEGALLDMWNVDPTRDYKHLLNDYMGFYWEQTKKPDGKIKWYDLWGQWQNASWRKTFDRNIMISYLALTTIFFIKAADWGSQLKWNLFGHYNSIFPGWVMQPIGKFFSKLSFTSSSKEPPSISDVAGSLESSLKILKGGKKVEGLEEQKNFAKNIQHLSGHVKGTRPTSGNVFLRFFNPGFVHWVSDGYKEAYDDIFVGEESKNKDDKKTGEIVKHPFRGSWKFLSHSRELMWCTFWTFVAPFYVFRWLSGRIRSYGIAFKRAYQETWSVSRLAEAVRALQAKIGSLPDREHGALELFNQLKVFVSECDNADLNRALESLKGKTYSPASLTRLYKILFSIKEPFSKIMEAVGEIDAFCSLATLFRKGGFCFPVYTKTKRPHMRITDGWDLLTGFDGSVVNGMELGGVKREQNAIISGPNAGGKSTFMRMYLFSAVMGQTCGIVPGKSCTFAPFHYIDSYVNVEDDPVAKKSLFRMQAYRVSNLIQNIEALKSDQFALVIADEMFSGTNPRDASCIGRAVANKICRLKNSIWLISTHYPEIRRIERDSGGVFANFKVGVHRDSAGKFIGYPFTITRGTTEESTALDVLETENFHSGILDDAKRILGQRSPS
ncbi:hypothetical protein ACFLY6_02775 [Candidatus Dependentiae bacterium]